MAPARQTYPTHRYCVRPSSMAPAGSKTSGKPKPPPKVEQATAVLVGLRRLIAQWRKKATELENSQQCRLMTDEVAKRSKIDTLRKVADKAEDLLGSK